MKNKILSILVVPLLLTSCLSSFHYEFNNDISAFQPASGTYGDEPRRTSVAEHHGGIAAADSRPADRQCWPCGLPAEPDAQRLL